ncbi:MAG: ATP-binding cassette domain-containing protein [Propionibacteriaceae bacterium]|jgi:ABC-2 type transport system ATP-binding protein|nr:ATP-binding cassette domain-containing protein [Propionibacteriaceae bacterium]
MGGFGRRRGRERGTAITTVSTAAAPLAVLDSVSRVFKVAERESGRGAVWRSLFHRRHRFIQAIDQVSFSLYAGEIVGLLGPNGCGKTTTLKCVAGLLTPTSGSLDVLGFVPQRRPVEFLRQIGFIMGQRSQLNPDVSVFDSLAARRVIYGLSPAQFASSQDELVELLGLAQFGDAPVRQLSLGQRMRCELAAALLHQPKLVLLDEPTIGLDFDAQAAIRTFVKAYAASHRAGIVLTSHYLADIEALAQRVLVLAGGRLVFSGQLDQLRHLDDGRKLVTVRCREAVETVGGTDDPDDPAQLAATPWAGLVTGRRESEIELTADRDDLPELLRHLSRQPGVSDLQVGDPPLEVALGQLYAASASPDNPADLDDPGSQP